MKFDIYWKKGRGMGPIRSNGSDDEPRAISIPGALVAVSFFAMLTLMCWFITSCASGVNW